MNSLITTLELYFGKKAPQMPRGLKEFIVKVAPYLIILGVIITGLSLLAILPLVLGSSAIYSAMPMMSAYGSHSTLWLGLIIAAATVVLQIMAIPGLFKRTSKSWDLVFYASLVGLVHMLISMNLVVLVINAVISWYILFQVRPYYIGQATMGESPIDTTATAAPSQPSSSEAPTQTPPTA